MASLSPSSASSSSSNSSVAPVASNSSSATVASSSSSNSSVASFASNSSSATIASSNDSAASVTSPSSSASSSSCPVASSSRSNSSVASVALSTVDVSFPSDVSGCSSLFSHQSSSPSSFLDESSSLATSVPALSRRQSLPFDSCFIDFGHKCLVHVRLIGFNRGGSVTKLSVFGWHESVTGGLCVELNIVVWEPVVLQHLGQVSLHHASSDVDKVFVDDSANNSWNLVGFVLRDVDLLQYVVDNGVDGVVKEVAA